MSPTNVHELASRHPSRLAADLVPHQRHSAPVVSMSPRSPWRRRPRLLGFHLTATPARA